MKAAIAGISIAIEILISAMLKQMPIELALSEQLTLCHRESDFSIVIYNLFLV
jgi:hypothetical protein